MEGWHKAERDFKLECFPPPPFFLFAFLFVFLEGFIAAFKF